MTQGARTAASIAPKRPLSVDGVRPRSAQSVDAVHTLGNTPKPGLKPQLIRSRPSTATVVKSVPKTATLTRPAQPSTAATATAAPAPSKPTHQPITPRPTVRTQSEPTPAPKTTDTLLAQPVQVPDLQVAATKRTASNKRQQLYVALALLAGGVGGFLVQAVWFGVVAIVVYGIFVFIMRIPSRTTFALAGVSIATISSLFLIKPSPELASNFATYTFMLLVIGVISLVRESRPPSVRTLRERNERRQTRNTVRA